MCDTSIPVNILYYIHSRKNAIISVGCISIHLVALRRTRLTAHVFFDWRHSRKGAGGRAYRSESTHRPSLVSKLKL